MRTIVVGDIHGCYGELRQLIEDLKYDRVYRPDTDRLIFLGDYIDRGDNPRMVIKYIRNLQEKHDNVIALMGNHEDMMVDFVDGDYDSGWTWNGNRQTLDSYEGHHMEFLDDVEWARNLPLYFEDDNFIYVHAGIDKHLPMNKQKRDTLLWVRNDFIYGVKKYNKKVVFGHTPISLEPYYTYSDDLCLDSGCVYGGCLTAACIEDGEVKGLYEIKKGEYDMSKIIRIVSQAFYGNRVLTEIGEDEVDRFILGYLDKDSVIPPYKEIDRTVVKIPNTDIVVIYNKTREERRKHLKPLAEIPELDLKIYSRCIACRMDENGELQSIEPEDGAIVMKYFAA